jgi:hypothetical protein
VNIIEQIRVYFGEQLLRKKLDEKRKTRVHNFDDARSVALLYREKGESFFILVKQYVKYLKSEHGIRDIMAMCYIDDKKTVPHYHVHRLKYDYFTRGDVNWRYEVKCDQVDNFIDQQFDILIDFEKKPSLPLQFILAESKAAFKVGYYHSDHEELYDMMLHAGEQDTFDEYIKQVNHYLKRINTKHARA